MFYIVQITFLKLLNSLSIVWDIGTNYQCNFTIEVLTLARNRTASMSIHRATIKFKSQKSRKQFTYILKRLFRSLKKHAFNRKIQSFSVKYSRKFLKKLATRFQLRWLRLDFLQYFWNLTSLFHESRDVLKR
jgi:hypothetical protein